MLNSPDVVYFYYTKDSKLLKIRKVLSASKYTWKENCYHDSISLIVDDVPSHQYVAAYGKAEIIERDYGNLLRLLVEKYVPAERVEQSVQGTLSNPSRVLVMLRPERIITL